MATTFDGYPMAQQGRAAEALTAAFTSSFIGSLVAVMLITFLAPMISSFALKFGPPEFFAVYLLTFCSFVGLGREAKHKTVISMALGLLIAGIGMDTVSGNLRMTFGSPDLLRGINFLVAVIGLFGISEILLTMEERLALRGHAAGISLRVVLSVWRGSAEILGDAAALLRSSVAGSASRPAAPLRPPSWATISPNGSRKDPESFGKGRIEGVFAPETAAMLLAPRRCCRCWRSAFPVPAPRRSCSAALMVWGLNPGPLLFVRAQGFRLGPDRLDVSRQRGRPRAGRRQPVPWLFFVSTRGPATSMTSCRRSPLVLTNASGHSVPARCPPFTKTVVPHSAASRLPWFNADSQSAASGSPNSMASSGRFGVIRSANGRRARSACSADPRRRRSPLVATITGSRTTTAGRTASSQPRTSSITAASPSIPILTASMAMSVLMASNCCRRNSTGGTCTALTPSVFWAVKAVTAAMP